MGRPHVRRKTRCPECLAPIWLNERTQQYDPVTCPECHTSLEVISLNPLSVDYMPEDEGMEWEEPLDEESDL